MKNILTTCVLLTGVNVAIGQTFEENFKTAFQQSIKGFESLKGAQAGTQWVSTLNFSDFETSNIIKDEDKGLLAIELTTYHKSLAEATDDMARHDLTIEKLLPAGDYKKNRTYDPAAQDYMRTVYEFNSSDFAAVRKRPAVYMGIYEYSGRFAYKLWIYEPYFKNQYQPKW